MTQKTRHEQVIVEGTQATYNVLIGDTVHPQAHASLRTVHEKLSQLYHGHRSFSYGLAPFGLAIRDIFQQDGRFVVLIEQAPDTRTLKWLRDDSKAQHGPHATYRDVRIALPWVLFFISVSADGIVGRLNSVYFRNTALATFDDTLCEPHLPNCSIQAYGATCWMCDQYYQRPAAGARSLLAAVHHFIGYFLSIGFNASSEYYEANGSFWERNRKKIDDTRVSTIAHWEQASRKDRHFAITVPWIEAGVTVHDVYRELTVGDQWTMELASDFGRVISQC